MASGWSGVLTRNSVTRRSAEENDAETRYINNIFFSLIMVIYFKTTSAGLDSWDDFHFELFMALPIRKEGVSRHLVSNI